MTTSVAALSRTLLTAAENPGSSGQGSVAGHAGCAAGTLVTKDESAVLDPLLSHPSTSAADADTESASNGALPVRLTGNRGCAERVHDPDRLVVPVAEGPFVVLSEWDKERSSLASHLNVNKRRTDRAFD